MHMNRVKKYTAIPDNVRKKYPPCATFDQLAAHLKLTFPQLRGLVHKYPKHWPEPIFKNSLSVHNINYYDRKKLGIWWKYVQEQEQIKQESKESKS